MRYLLLLYLPNRPEPGSPEGKEMFGAVRDFHQRCREAGVLVAASPLQDPSTAVTVRERDGQLLRTAGPFAETTEWLAGYFLVDCRDEDHAREIAADCPITKDGSVELRPVRTVP